MPGMFLILKMRKPMLTGNLDELPDAEVDARLGIGLLVLKSTLQAKMD